MISPIYKSIANLRSICWMVLASMLFCLPSLIAQQAESKVGARRTPDKWRSTKSFDGLYKAIAKDLVEGKPLVMVTYCGLWQSNRPPEEDLHWGTRFGPWRMFDRAQQDEHVRDKFVNHKWDKVHFEKNSEDPVRLAVFKQVIAPNERWQSFGVTKSFDMYHVMLAFSDRKAGAMEMAKTLRWNRGRKVKLDGNTELDLGKDARILGYNGHNFYYDGEFMGLHYLQGAPGKIKACFAVGCTTSTDYAYPLIDEGIYGVLFTTSFMAPEGYNLLALADALSQAKTGEAMCKQSNEAYQYFQVLGGNRRPGPLFVNQAYRLFDE